MKAVICDRYGAPDVLTVLEVPQPVPLPNEVLIRVHAALVAPPDCAFRKADPFAVRFVTGLFRPKKRIPGTEFAGIIAATGNAVTRFKVGDRVFGSTSTAFGAHAEYMCLPEDKALAWLPASLSFAEGASLCEMLTSLPFLRKGNIGPGQKVLINGASGSIGGYAVQLARFFGAEVTGVCSGGNAEHVRKLGADHIIDYTAADFTQESGRYDLIFDAIGKSTFKRCKKALTENGMYLTTRPAPFLLLGSLFRSKTRGKRGYFLATGLRAPADRAADLVYSGELAEAGSTRVVIDRTYALEEIREAHVYVETGRKKGSVVMEF